MLSLIAAIGKNRELGLNNQLIFHLPEDMAYFKETTLGHPVLMGKKTFDSIGRPLPGRENLVATRHPETLPASVTAVPDLAAFLEKNATTPEEIFVIGGASIYAAALSFATHLYLTEIAASRPADAFFPTFDPQNYTRTLIKEGKDHDLTYAFAKYTKR